MYTILQDAIVLWNIEFQLTRRCYKLKTLEITLTRRCCSVKRWHHFFRTTLFCSALKSLLRNGQSLSSWHMTNFSNKMTLRCGILHNNSSWKSGSERRICPLKLETTFKGTVSKSKAFSDMNCWFGTKESTTNWFYIFLILCTIFSLSSSWWTTLWFHANPVSATRQMLQSAARQILALNSVCVNGCTGKVSPVR